MAISYAGPVLCFSNQAVTVASITDRSQAEANSRRRSIVSASNLLLLNSLLCPEA